MDNGILSGLFKTHETGEMGSAKTSLLHALNGGAQVVAVNPCFPATTGLKIAKLRVAKHIVLQLDMDTDNARLFMAISAKHTAT